MCSDDKENIYALQRLDTKLNKLIDCMTGFEQYCLSMGKMINYTQNLENCIGYAENVPEENVEMAKDRIRRRVIIDGKQQWITGMTEQEYAENLLRAMNNGGQNRAKHNFAEYANQWFEVYSKPNVEVATASTYERQLRKHIFPSLGEKYIEDVTSDDVQQLFNAMNGTKATKDKTRIVLNMILDNAVEDGILKTNPAKSKRIKITGNRSQETVPYTREQMCFLASRLSMIHNETDRAYMALQLAHPLRLEEVLGLKWKDIDRKNFLLHIERAVTHPDRNQPVVKDTKTTASQRTIALVPQIVTYLTDGRPEDFVLGGRKPLSYTQVQRMCERIQRDTGFDEKITPRRFRTTVLTDIYDVTRDIK